MKRPPIHARLLALVLAIVFAGSGVVAMGDLHDLHDLHHGDDSCESLAPVAPVATVVTACLDHEHPPGVEHIESALTPESRLCPACLLRSQSASQEMPKPGRLDAPAPAVGAVSLPASPARSALLERTAAPRGPPTSSVV